MFPYDALTSELTELRMISFMFDPLSYTEKNTGTSTLGMKEMVRYNKTGPNLKEGHRNLFQPLITV